MRPSDVREDNTLAFPLPTMGLAAVLLALAVATRPATATAEDLRWQSAASAHSRQRVHKLTWLPYRPSTPSRVVEASAVEPIAQRTATDTAPAAQRPAGEAFADPFGDKEGMPVASAPAVFPVGSPLEDSPILPSLDSGLGPGQFEPIEECPSPYDPNYYTRIDELRVDISPEGQQLPPECTVAEEVIQPFALGGLRQDVLGEPWTPTTFTWKASALCHKPLYFEEVHLERYGHSWGPRLQPLMSGAHFYLTILSLPYKMGLYPPRECIYPLGYYRPGSCAPHMLDPLPLSVRAGLAEAGVWTGMAALIP